MRPGMRLILPVRRRHSSVSCRTYAHLTRKVSLSSWPMGAPWRSERCSRTFSYFLVVHCGHLRREGAVGGNIFRLKHGSLNRLFPIRSFSQSSKKHSKGFYRATSNLKRESEYL